MIGNAFHHMPHEKLHPTIFITNFDLEAHQTTEFQLNPLLNPWLAVSHKTSFS